MLALELRGPDRQDLDRHRRRGGGGGKVGRGNRQVQDQAELAQQGGVLGERREALVEIDVPI